MFEMYICILNVLFFPDEPTKLYPFFYRAMFPILEDGWTAFRPETEYSQLVTSQADEWRISYINKDFSVCWMWISYTIA
jgi:myotubularin-related protein 9